MNALDFARVTHTARTDLLSRSGVHAPGYGEYVYVYEWIGPQYSDAY